MGPASMAIRIVLRQVLQSAGAQAEREHMECTQRIARKLEDLEVNSRRLAGILMAVLLAVLSSPPQAAQLASASQAFLERNERVLKRILIYARVFTFYMTILIIQIGGLGGENKFQL